METLGKRIKQLREKNKLTQNELGIIVNLHGSNIGRIEKEKVSPTADVILKIAKYFNVSCDWLLKGENTNLQICKNAENKDIFKKFNKLPTEEQKEIEKLIDWKLEKIQEKVTSSNLMTTETKDKIG